MRGLVALVSLLAAAVALGRSPNVVLIMADDLGYGELGAYGQRLIRTPHLDALAAEGRRYTQFYSASPVCAPTRTSLMTGKHQGHAAIRGNREIGGWELNSGEGQWPLPAAEVTMAEAFRAKGYVTGIFGKWGLGGPASEGHPLYQGFDRFFGYLCQRQAHNFYPTHLWNGHQVWILSENDFFPSHARMATAPEDPAEFNRFLGKQYAIDEIDREALKFIEENKDKPFFLYLPSTLPHAALQAPPEWVDRYPESWDPVPYLGQNSYVPCRRPRATYAAMISRLDHTVGQVVAQLKAQDLYEDTIIIFTSDNGASFNGGVDREFFRSNGDLRGYKTQLWEGGIRVPLIMRGPAVEQGVDHRPSAIYDLLATLGRVCALDAEPFDGVDILAAAPRSRVLYWEFPEGSSWRAVRRGDWKAIQPNLKAGSPTELYNLSRDPRETRNVAGEYPNIVQELERLMDEHHVPNEVFPLPGVD